MRMLKWICGVRREDRIRKECVNVSIGIASIVNKIIENSLR